jgi:hypothetical protein
MHVESGTAVERDFAAHREVEVREADRSKWICHIRLPAVPD